MRRDFERVQVRLQEVRPDRQSLFFDLFDIFEHAQGKLTLDFLGDARVKPGIERKHRAVLHQCVLNDLLDAVSADAVPSNVDHFEVLVVAERRLQTLREFVTKLISTEDELPQAALVENQLSLVIDNMSLVFEHCLLRLVLSLFDACEHLLDLEIRVYFTIACACRTVSRRMEYLFVQLLLLDF